MAVNEIAGEQVVDTTSAFANLYVTDTAMTNATGVTFSFEYSTVFGGTLSSLGTATMISSRTATSALLPVALAAGDYVTVVVSGTGMSNGEGTVTWSVGP